MNRRILLAVALTLSVAVLATVPVAGQGPDVNRTADDPKSLLDKVVDGVSDAAQGVGDAAQETGDGVGSTASAVGRAIEATIRALGRAAQAAAGLLVDATDASLTILAGMGIVVGLGLSGALGSLSAGLGSGLSGLGSTLTAGLAWGGLVLASGFSLLGSLIADGILSYIGFVAGLRPEHMPPIAFGAVAVTGAAASTGVGSWAGWQAIRKWGLVGAPMLAGFSRIENDDLLEHPLRSQIFQVIQTNPGIHASGLAREVGAGWGTITHHLEKLERGLMVTTRKVNNQKCFFENGGLVSRHDMQVAGAVKGDTASDIAGFVASHPMTSQKGMAESLNLSPALISFHVKKLVNLGVLDKVRHGKETLLTTSEALRRIMAAEKSPIAHAELRDESFQYSS